MTGSIRPLTQAVQAFIRTAEACTRICPLLDLNPRPWQRATPTWTGDYSASPPAHGIKLTENLGAKTTAQRLVFDGPFAQQQAHTINLIVTAMVMGHTSVLILASRYGSLVSQRENQSQINRWIPVFTMTLPTSTYLCKNIPLRRQTQKTGTGKW